MASITDAFGLHNLLYPFGDHFFGAVCLLLPFQQKKRERERETEQYRKTILQETKKTIDPRNLKK